MHKLVAAIEYDGTKFQGSQKQPKARTAISIEYKFI